MAQVFLSYARHDWPSVQPLVQSLGVHDIAVWRDQDNLYGGQHWPKAIGEAIAAADRKFKRPFGVAPAGAPPSGPQHGVARRSAVWTYCAGWERGRAIRGALGFQRDFKRSEV